MEAVGPPVIADYALIGDTRCAALVSSCGSIDWWCLPRFDSDPVFGCLVGGPPAGRFAISPPFDVEVTSRRYRHSTSTVLETELTGKAGRLRMTDGMVGSVRGQFLPDTLLVRRVEALDHDVEVDVLFDPRRGSTHTAPRDRREGDALMCVWGDLAVSLSSDPPLGIRPGQGQRVVVSPGRPLTATVCVGQHSPVVVVSPAAGYEALMRDDDRWRTWGEGIGETGPYRDAVLRSLTTLRLLTYTPSGAPVAAATTSLPEVVGGSRNWDYRYAWPRDAALGIGAFVGVSTIGEARAFLFWLLHASRLDRPRLRPVLTLDGKPVPSEVELEDWPGYRGSKPVRFGNDARTQHQLDTYGWVVDAASLLAEAGQRLYPETWRVIAGFADYVCRHWREPDAGIWEVRSPSQFVHSKLLGWLALDRAARIARSGYRISSRRLGRWQQQRDAIAAELLARGYDSDRGTYVRSYGSTELDAALLILPLLGLDADDSRRVRGTIEAIRRDLDAGNGLLFRYPRGKDGLDGDEGAFLPCSFWLVQALAKTGRIDEAAGLFEALLSYGSEVGLFGEEVDPTTGEMLGNYPQALTHATVVQAALALRDATTVEGAARGRSHRPDAR